MDSVEKAIAFFEKDSSVKVHSISRVGGGTGNDVFLVNFQHIVRIKKKNEVDDPFNTPITEGSAIAAAQQVDGAPIVPLNAYNVRTGDKIEMAILETEPLLSPLSVVTRENLHRVIDAIKILHEGKTKIQFHHKERFNSYKKKSGERLPAGFEKKVVATAFRIFDNEPQVLSHNDLWEGNILLTPDNGRCYFIDFEFASSNADVFDLASLLEENEIDEDLCAEAVSYYYHSDDPALLEKVQQVMLYLDALWFYWAMARYHETGKETFFSIAKTKKARFLRAFHASLN